MRKKANSVDRARSTLGLGLSLLVAALTAAGCGYHVAGHASQLPSDWRDIAVPAFKNDTTTYRIEQRIPVIGIEPYHFPAARSSDIEAFAARRRK